MQLLKLEKEVWPLSWESNIKSVPQTQLLHPREVRLAIVWGIKNSFITLNATTQP